MASNIWVQNNRFGFVFMAVYFVHGRIFFSNIDIELFDCVWFFLPDGTVSVLNISQNGTLFQARARENFHFGNFDFAKLMVN